MTRLGLILMIALAAAGCSRISGTIGIGQGREPLFDGERFRGSARPETRDKQNFVATVRPVEKSLEGAIQAAEYKGIKHCIKYYGTSEIDWEVGPDTPRDALMIENGALSLMGACVDK